MLDTMSDGRIKLRHERTTSMAALRRLLVAGEYQVLIINAHGSKRGTQTGVWLENDFITDLDAPLPPLVIFCSCGIWARAQGAVSIADLALRRGAVAVLGTLFPVDVRHNTTLVTRIFVYIAEAMKRNERLETFAHAAHQAISTNAIIDVIRGSAWVEEWAYTEAGPSGLTPLVEFMNVRSVGQLRPGHIFADTERVLIEIASSHGAKAERHVRQMISARNYAPESLFYVQIGWPDRIVLRPRLEEEESEAYAIRE